ncbi:MAG: SRPBCC family protein [Pseudomonadota bacterium]
MNQELQIQLLEELLGLKQQSALFLDDQPTTNAVSHYVDPARFQREQEQVFARHPQVIAHVSELSEPNSYMRVSARGLPLLLLRGDDGQLRVFLNVCRHRGTRLVDGDSGCRKRFSCPYHGWTWNSRGEFVNAPHFEAGFPGTDPAELGLKTVPAIERHGFIWLLPERDEAPDPTDFFSAIDDDLAWVGIDQLTVHQSEWQERRCNWKMLVEGGLEAYHFRVAHRKTIAKRFNDNLSSYHTLGPHLRSILPRSSIVELEGQPKDTWDIRQHANVLYTLFPKSMLLVQADHVIWISVEPQAPDLSLVRMTTLIPRETEQSQDYWDKNHELTVTTLNEDFDLAESIQSGLTSGANDRLRFGRYEGALNVFNDNVESCLS